MDAAIEKNRQKARTEKEKVLGSWRPVISELGGPDNRAVQSFKEVLQSVLKQ